MILRFNSKKKTMSIILIVVMMMNMMISSIAFAVDNIDGNPNFDYRFSKIELLVNGSDIPTDDPTFRIGENDDVTINFEWEVDNTANLDGTEELIYTIPEVIYLGTDDSNGTLPSGSDNFGTWTLDVSTRELSVKFADVAAAMSNVKGTVTLDREFRYENLNISVPYEFQVPINGVLSKTYKIYVEPKDGTKVEKNGQVNGGIASQLDWTIDINTTLETLTTPQFVDTFDNRLNYTPGSLHVYHLDVKADGTKVLGAEILSPGDFTLEPIVSNVVDFEFNTNINTAYRVIYSTDVDITKINLADSTFNYTNNAVFNGSSDTATITVNTDPLLSKEGTLESLYNADFILWEVIINPEDYNLPEVDIVDIIPIGLNFDLTSISVKDGSGVNFGTNDGSGNGDEFTSTLSNGNQTLTVDFTNNVTEKLILSYKTTVDSTLRAHNLDQLSFTNNVTMNFGAGGSLNINGNSTETVKTGRVIYKKGTKSIGYTDNKMINWTLDINTSGIDLGTDFITDTIDARHKLDLTYGTKGFKIYPLTIDKGSASNGDDTSSDPDDINANITLGAQLLTGDYTVTKLDDGVLADPANEFKLKFLANITTAYRIEYRTILIKDGSGNYASSHSNTGTVGVYSSTKAVSTSFSNTYSKTSTNVDYNTNILSWEIAFNPLKFGMTTFTINDDFSDDQLMTDAQFNAIVVKKGAAVLVEGAGNDYTLTKVADGANTGGYVLTFLAEVNDNSYTVEYNTTMDPDVVSNNGDLNYSNTATITWDGGGSTNISKSPTINTHADHNGQKSGTLDEANKKIDWIVDLNYLSKNLNAFNVTDTIESSQRLTANSVKVYTYNVDVNGAIDTVVLVADLVAGGITITEDVSNNTFEVTFPSLSTPYRIAYSTDFEGISKTSYGNTANTTYGENYSATVAYSNGDKFVEKSGIRTGTSHVDWSILVNKSQSNISNITLSDTLSEGMSLDQTSFVLKDKSGGALVFDDYFDVVVETKILSTDPTTFTMTSKQAINDKMTIEYKANIVLDAILENKLTNVVTFVGNQVTSGEREDTSVISHAFFTGSGTGSGEVGSFTMTKVDKDDPTIKLQGVEFELYKGATLLGNLTTDVNGEITLERLKYATYTLKELNVPEGYKIDDPETTFTVNSTVKQLIVIENERVRSIRIKKVDKNNVNIVLSGAEFEIYDAGDNLLHTVTTDGTGFANKTIDVGTYKVVEIKAPSNYYLDSDPQTIVVDNSAISFDLVFENNRRPTPPSVTPPVVDEPEEEPEEEVKEEPIEEPEKKIEEKTTTDVPKEGVVEIPEGSTPKVDEEPENGSVEVDDSGKWTYTPDPGFEGEDSFTIKVENPDGSEEIIYFEFDVEETPLGFVNLPQTGEYDSNMRYVLGGLFLLIGIVLFRSKK